MVVSSPSISGDHAEAPEGSGAGLRYRSALPFGTTPVLGLEWSREGRSMRHWLAVVSVMAAIAGCGGSDHFTCAIGSLTGTWRVHYDQTNGNCGPINDETVIAGSPAPANCTIMTNQVSADHCRVDSAFTCPTADSRGSQAWVVTFTQTSNTQLAGSGTVQVNHPTLGTCRSTYNLTMTK